MELNTTGQRREREERERRDHILGVAEELFAKNGFHHTTVARIAKEAEFGVGTIYKYFGDKNGLLRALIDYRLIPHYQEIESALFGGDSIVQTLDQFMECYFESVRKREAFFRVWCQDLLPTNMPAWDGAIDFHAIDERRAKLFARITELFEKGSQRGDFVEMNATHLAAALVGIMQSFVLLGQKNGSCDWSVDRVKDALRSVFFEKVLLDRNGSYRREAR